MLALLSHTHSMPMVHPLSHVPFPKLHPFSPSPLYVSLVHPSMLSSHSLIPTFPYVPHPPSHTHLSLCPSSAHSLIPTLSLCSHPPTLIHPFLCSSIPLSHDPPFPCALIRISTSFVLCYLLPAYSSYKALRTGSRKAVIKLLMYWTVLSVFKGGEVFSDFFLGWSVAAP